MPVAWFVTAVWLYPVRPTDDVLETHEYFMFGFSLAGGRAYTIDRWGVGLVGEMARAIETKPIRRLNADKYYREEGWQDHLLFVEGAERRPKPRRPAGAKESEEAHEEEA